MLKNALRYILFILVQVYVLFQIPPLHRFVVPYLYFLYILWLPFNMSRTNLLIVSFFTVSHSMRLHKRPVCTPRPAH